jgi:hypothetical protein
VAWSIIPLHSQATEQLRKSLPVKILCLSLAEHLFLIFIEEQESQVCHKKVRGDSRSHRKSCNLYWSLLNEVQTKNTEVQFC